MSSVLCLWALEFHIQCARRALHHFVDACQDFTSRHAIHRFTCDVDGIAANNHALLLSLRARIHIKDGEVFASLANYRPQRAQMEGRRAPQGIRRRRRRRHPCRCCGFYRHLVCTFKRRSDCRRKPAEERRTFLDLLGRRRINNLHLLRHLFGRGSFHCRWNLELQHHGLLCRALHLVLDASHHRGARHALHRLTCDADDLAADRHAVSLPLGSLSYMVDGDEPNSLSEHHPQRARAEGHRTP